MARRYAIPSVITALLVTIVGIGMVGLGGWLVALGGSWYFVIAGAALIVSAAYVVRCIRVGLQIFTIVFVGTAIWAVNEVGLDGWKLIPRLMALGILGIWLSILDALIHSRGMRRWPAATAAFYVISLAAIVGAGYHTSNERIIVHAQPAAALSPASGVPGNDWRYYGNTPAGQRFAAAAQVSPANVGKLRQAWRYDSGDMPKQFETENGREFNFEATPIKVGDSLYFCTPHHWVISLDATTGAQRWKYDPHADTSANEYLACRGVAYFDTSDSRATCRRRILTTTGDTRLIALDADTGRPCESFGNHGSVSLTDHMGEVPAGFHFITSQPLVVRDRIILGGWIYDNQSMGEPSGVVRAYDPVTGKLAWAWDLGRANPNAPLGPDESYTRGTPNGWGTYTADPELGLVYIPLGNATPDYFGGGRRPFDDAYSSALVALDIETGQERWHFQTVHHDVWDFDLPIGPTLVDLPSPDGKPLPALVQTTKMGQLFLLDRRTGKPLASVEEKPVSNSPSLPGERPSATQPFSTGMPDLGPPKLRASDIWGATPLDHLWCRIQFRRANYKGLYTMPVQGLNLLYPAFDGVIDWYGATVDPARHLLIANTSYIPFTMKVLSQDAAFRKGMTTPWAGWGSGQPYPKPKDFSIGPQFGTPYVAVVKPWLSPIGAPCNAPPWGKLIAIDLVTRRIAWERPVGTTRDTNLFNTHTNVGLPTGIFQIGGNIVTAGGLIFMGATSDYYLRAFDERNGKELWRARLPAGGQATPMSYMGRDGRQYVVIAAGGHGGLRTRNGDSVVAFALPR
ncbi:membrane-bound PQQ-dependent dehydrogenase, glucose/quinate/shikimate family [Cupriavidus pauculus]|uniref:membrane-bound PQQ-dependent dehydrogenase, glucose/quinate/shikimate family n=1 Tax=Cupriavidus pauculus TaxID=82633 RepID=UPI000784D187|nr:membrane-bound PQQ-dependent dehydrogenase, glucose/quinate/shikimate family [Cupriavidus pauculus]